MTPLSLPAYAREKRIPLSTLYNRLAAQKLPGAVKIGGRWFVFGELELEVRPVPELEPPKAA